MLIVVWNFAAKLLFYSNENWKKSFSDEVGWRCIWLETSWCLNSQIKLMDFLRFRILICEYFWTNFSFFFVSQLFMFVFYVINLFRNIYYWSTIQSKLYLFLIYQSILFLFYICINERCTYDKRQIGLLIINSKSKFEASRLPEFFAPAVYVRTFDLLRSYAATNRNWR